ALLMFALMGLLPIRKRFGFAGLAIGLGVVWLVDFAVLSRLPAADAPISVWADLTLGTGGTWGPSAFHSISLVIAGMVFGHVLYHAQRVRAAVIVAVALLLLSGAIVALEMAAHGPIGFFRGI